MSSAHAPITENTALVFIKPHALKAGVEDLLTEVFAKHDLRVQRHDIMSCREIDEEGIIDRHYSAIARYAMFQGPETLSLTPAAEATFAATFQVDWKQAVEKGIVLNAKQASAALGLDGAQLGRKWALAPAPRRVKLAPGLYASEFPEDGIIVLNGFYLANREKFTKPTESVHWYIVSWDESKLSWKSFRADVLGCTNPADAPVGSLRRNIFDRWEEFGLKERPNVSDNGVHGSAGPIEGLNERMVWLHATLRDDFYANSLLLNDVPASMIEKVLANPVITIRNQQGLAFDLLEDLQSSEVATLLKELAEEALRIPLRNNALMFIKPHAANHSTKALLEATLALRGIRVDMEGTITGETILNRRVIDRHYSALARYAMDWKPSQIVLDEAAQQMFEATFRIPWITAVKRQRVFNAVDAAQELGDVSPKDLWLVWSAHEKRLKLAPGLYVTYFDEQDIYVLNGFYLANREKFTTKGATVMWLAVSWDESILSWRDFRALVVGCTNPADAVEGSIRRAVFDQWKVLGLREAPNTSDNGIHASASPLEAMAERHIWLNQRLENDVLCRMAEQRQASATYLVKWVQNPVITVEGRTGCAFDLFEDADTVEVLRLLRRAEEELRHRVTENTALVFIKPHAVNTAVIDFVTKGLAERGIKVVREGSIASEDIEKRRIIDRHYRVISQYALGQVSLDQIQLPKSTLDQFFNAFRITWQDALHEGRVCCAQDAATQLGRISATEVAEQWNEATKIKLAPGLMVGQFTASGLFVLNGFYLRIREAFTAPNARVHWFVVSWEESALSWKTFRADVIGSTNPHNASDQSLRRRLLSQWRDLGLPDAPNVTDNGIHASAGPLEGLCERSIWLNADPLDDDVGVKLMFTGVPQEVITSLMANPVIKLPLGDAADGAAGTISADVVEGRAFDLLEDINTSDAAKKIFTVYQQTQATLSRNNALIFIKPHAVTGPVQALVERELDGAGIHIESIGTITAERMYDERLVDQHYGAIARYALETPSRLNPSEEAKVNFEVECGVSWATTVASDMVISAKEALSRFGAAGLSKRWASAAVKVKLAPGFYVGQVLVDAGTYKDGDVVAPEQAQQARDKLPQEGQQPSAVFVVNGFYPGMVEKFTAAGKKILWFSVSWDADKLSWADFRRNVVGSTDPAKATAGSIRARILEGWRELELLETPNVSDNGIHASAGPLEGLAERRIWLQIDIEKDTYAQALTMSGLEPSVLELLLKNPVLSWRDRTGPAFDLLEDQQSADCASALLDLQCLVKSDSILREGASSASGERGGKQSSTSQPISKFQPRNHAFVFIKPHALTSGVLTLVDVVFKDHRIRVEMEGEMISDEIYQRRIMDRHYSTIYRYAEEWNPDRIRLNAESELLFQDTFQISWSSAVSDHMVLNAAAAAKLLDVGPDELKRRWDDATTKIKLAPGLYIARFLDHDIYVINGFYLANKGKFIAPSARVHWYVVSWSETAFTWEDFRAKVIGPTNPSKAPLDSIRGTIYNEYAALGLKTQPDTADNGIHASAGPLEGFAERAIWLGTKPTDDLFAKVALQCGCSTIVLLHWASNPVVTLPSGKEGYAFDLLEDTQTTDAVRALVSAEEARKAAPAINTAFAFIKPHAINRYVGGLVEAAFRENKIDIIQEGEIFSDAIAAKGLIDRHYNTIAKYAMHVEPKHITISEASQQKFRSVYAVSWAEAVSNGIVLNAVDACAALGGIDAGELNRRWSIYVNRIKLAPGLYITEFVDEGFYVINGFYLLNREKFTAPKKRIHFYVLRWKESDLTWKDFRARIIGATDPARADQASLRSTLLRQWESIGLEFAPNVSDNGIHASAGPLEGLAERMIWLGTPLEQDEYGQTLLTNGANADLLTDWVTNNPMIALPSISGGSANSPDVGSSCVFDQLEDLQSSQVTLMIREATKLYGNGQSGKSKSGGAGGSGGSPSGYGGGLEELSEGERLKHTNSAFVFIKPHACTKEVIALLETTFRENGLHIQSTGTTYSYDMEKHNLLDQHYESIARHAMELKATSIQLTEEQKQQFREAFPGKEWATMVSESRVLNAVDAAYSLGHLSPTQLAKRWMLCENRIALSPGLWVGYSADDDLFLINGFYLFTREKYLSPEKKIQWFVVSWKEDDLTWQDFHYKLIGAMNPAEAEAGSVRNNIFQNWRSLGLETYPSTADNGVHASASPLEAFRERQIWLQTPTEEDAFGRALQLCKIDGSVVNRWCQNERVRIGDRTGFAFELVADKQTSEVINTLFDATAELMFEPIHHRDVSPKRKLFQSARRCDLFLNAVTEDELRDLFLLYDPEDVGSIDRTEFRADFERMENFGQAQATFDLEKLFSRYDKKRNGRMMFEEFTMIMMARQRL
ncbi:Hypothetical protein, putative [Bodo saltans]|uniref:EF-hand domain-containing protein n=1 Tax=Bodo saltans TaxID=75058 RepID=A0A0S4IQT6_BODSA|nr:Hypothetical protein, putative [Bodo saltans]|eukprot:CUF98075.1 Hypothetical protein, putative [Bodo saltans]